MTKNPEDALSAELDYIHQYLQRNDIVDATADGADGIKVIGGR